MRTELRQRREVGRRKENEGSESVVQAHPRLVEGVNLLEKPEGLPVFQALVADNLAEEASAVWIDSGNQASTYALRSYGNPSILERVEVARAFTPFQHHRTVEKLESFVTSSTDILVLPAVDGLYADGQLRDWEAEELFAEAWSSIVDLQERCDLKVLVSVSGSPLLSPQVESSADRTIEVSETGRGWVYCSAGFDQYGYRSGDGVQTTLSLWERRSEDLREVEG
ncbi:MAG: hypothetical protein ABEJ03_04975 [Candidatus Nanohaloarchaea archaeon]